MLLLTPLTIVDASESVHLAHTEHFLGGIDAFSLFVTRNASSFKISSAFLRLSYRRGLIPIRLRCFLTCSLTLLVVASARARRSSSITWSLTPPFPAASLCLWNRLWRHSLSPRLCEACSVFPPFPLPLVSGQRVLRVERVHGVVWAPWLR